MCQQLEYYIWHRRGLCIFFSLPDSFRLTIAWWAHRNLSVYPFLSLPPSLFSCALFLLKKRLSIHLPTESLFFSLTNRQESKFDVATPPKLFTYWSITHAFENSHRDWPNQQHQTGTSSLWISVLVFLLFFFLLWSC